MTEQRPNSNTSNSDKNQSTPQQGSIIYINEHLSKLNQNLLQKARSIREVGYKFIWSKIGRIFITENESSRIITIKSHEDVDKLAKIKHGNVARPKTISN